MKTETCYVCNQLVEVMDGWNGFTICKDCFVKYKGEQNETIK